MNKQISKLDQKILLQKVSGLNAKDLFMCDYKPSLSFFQKLHLKFLQLKRKRGVPIAYLTNTKEFYGRDFYVDKNVLIPRPETEQIIDITKSLNQSPKTILDIGTGSGCIATTLLSEIPEAKATLLDISTRALNIAKRNTTTHNTSSRSTFIKSDLLQNIDSNSVFELIVTNPPYIPKNDNNLVSPETKKYEPHLALFSGKDGLDCFREIFNQINLKKIKYHYIIGEFGFGQKQGIELLLQQNFEGYDYKIFDDLKGIPRIFLLTNKSWN